MTLAVLFRAIKEGRLHKTDEFIMSVNAWRNGGAPSGTSAMMVPVNTKATVEELIQGIAVQSGNDAAMCIAEGMAGTEAAFARMMNDEARRIGLSQIDVRECNRTRRSASTDDGARSRDARPLHRQRISGILSLFGQKEFLYRKHRFINRNPLLFLNIGADGLKTGHIAASGYGLVGSAVQDGKRLIVVVSGLEKADQRKDEAVKLLDWGFRSFSAVTSVRRRTRSSARRASGAARSGTCRLPPRTT